MMNTKLNLLETSVAFLLLVCGSAAQLQADTLTFQEGVGGYASTLDTFLANNAPDDVTNGTAGNVQVKSSSPERHGLVAFPGIIGPSLIPDFAPITLATLEINTVDVTTGTADLHAMLVAWNESSTWNTLGGGVQANNVEAVMVASASGTPSSTGTISFDVTSDVQAYANGASNFGWVFFNDASNNWEFDSSEESTILERPKLTVTFVPEPASWLLLGMVTTGTLGFGWLKRRWNGK